MRASRRPFTQPNGIMCASNSREGGADYFESTYLHEAGLPALTKTVAAKNSNCFSHGKKS